MVSTTAQHALRALILLAEPPAGRVLLGRELAKEADIPANYLSKVLLTLRNAGILTTTRGTRGGYELLKPASEVRLIEVVEIFDASRAKPSCLLGLKECTDDDPCPAHEAWKEVRTQYLTFLEATTLADISARSKLSREHGK